MQPQRKIKYVMWGNYVYATLVLLVTLLSTLPFGMETERLPVEIKIIKEDVFLLYFSFVTRMIWLVLGCGIWITVLKLRSGDVYRSRVVWLAMFCLLLSGIETAVEVFVLYPKVSLAIEGLGAVGGAIGSLLGFCLGAILPAFTIIVLRNPAVRGFLSERNGIASEVSAE
ncbi:MAG: hypothetical protein VX278_01760 [Myxococcota bacterium]|nr:hypothetical protein [Myxococcota bacterium]